MAENTGFFGVPTGGSAGQKKKKSTDPLYNAVTDIGSR